MSKGPGHRPSADAGATSPSEVTASGKRPTCEDVVQLIENMDPHELERLTDVLCEQAASAEPDRSDPIVRAILENCPDAKIEDGALYGTVVNVQIGNLTHVTAGKPMRLMTFSDTNCSKLAREIQSRCLQRPNTVAGADRKALCQEVNGLKAKLGRPRKRDLVKEVIKLREQTPKGRSFGQISKHLNAQGHDTTPDSVRKLYDRAVKRMRRRT
jgi:hypothetical protein